MDILEKIIKWAEGEEAIQALILQGSRTAHKASDAYSDYDISVFCKTEKPYTQTEEWLSRLGKVWVCVKEKSSCNGREFPTRLVIFEGGIKVDFSFLSLDLLNQMVRGDLPKEYHRGYRVLLDKSSLTQGMPKPLYQEPKAMKPSEREFLEALAEFWFEAYHVAIYLKREELWLVKFRSAAMHGFLLRLIEWEAEARNSWSQTAPPLGKRMASWVDPSTWAALHGVFAHFAAEDSWKALLHTLALFRDLSIQVSRQLGYAYPEALDQQITGFISELRK